ncbi:MAG: oxygen-independent coproporphyrinogen III oxidase [Limnobacter sp.]|nr:oxygen-independent coproporphyrinogen III oxidase [Limnobacter sp.]
MQSTAAVPPAPLEIDEDLLERFGGRGPRYTSYPTADRFHDGFGAADYERALQDRAQRRDDPLGLYVHVPFCRTICWYCACNKIGTKHQEQSAPYLEAVLRELSLVVDRIGRGHRVSHLHFGGGTPTFMPDSELARLIGAFRDAFDFADDDHGEYSIEVDPRTVDASRLRVLRDLGMNRVSLGVQDFDPDVQKAVNRIQPKELTIALIDAARDCGFRSVNVDLIYGLPKQTPESFHRTVEQTIDAQPHRIALYHYAHLPTVFKPQRRIHESELPSSAAKARMFEEAVRLFESAGYMYLGLDHFAKTDDEMAVAQREGRLHRNFQGYTSHDPGDLLALGVSGIASIGDVYAQNEKVLQPYYDALAAGRLPVARGIRLDADDFVRRDAIQALMCGFALDWDWLARRHGVDGARHFAAELTALSPMVDAGAVRIDEAGVTVLPRGRLLVRAVAMVFDRHLAAGARPAGGYSRIA